MIIKEDYSYLNATDKKAIEQGFATLEVFSIRLDRYFTEEEQAQNRKAAETLTVEEWGARCDMTRQKVGEQNEIALSALENAGLILGQYHTPSSFQNYDLWFWCNCGKNGRELDYITLSINDSLPLDKQREIFKQATAVLSEVNTANNCAIIQYTAIYNEQKLEEFVEEFVEQNVGKFIKNGFNIGKIIKINPELNGGYKYGFKKKNAKTHGYYLSAKAIYELSLENIT